MMTATARCFPEALEDGHHDYELQAQDVQRPF